MLHASLITARQTR